MTIDKATSRVWLEVDEDAFLHNYRLARSLCDRNAEMICVVKANAYGFGLRRAVQTLWEAGATWFAVAAPEEALAVRRALPDAHVLLMGPADAAYLPVLIQNRISLTVGTAQDGAAAAWAARQAGMDARVHVKLDTGLHRLGFAKAADALPLLSEKRLHFEGVYSHLALRSAEQSAAQYALFQAMTAELTAAGFCFDMRHLLDSIGLTRYPQWQMDAVRIGAFLYGNVPIAWPRYAEGRADVAAQKARVTRVAWVAAGEGVGYDDTPLPRAARVATIAAGYVDGYPRALSQKGFVSLRGRRAPVLGLVCMDQMMVDVTDVPGVCEGDTATLLGNDIPLPEYAKWGSLNRNECLALIGRRVPRVYLRGGSVVRIDAEMEDKP